MVTIPRPEGGRRLPPSPRQAAPNRALFTPPTGPRRRSTVRATYEPSQIRSSTGPRARRRRWGQRLGPFITSRRNPEQNKTTTLPRPKRNPSKTEGFVNDVPSETSCPLGPKKWFRVHLSTFGRTLKSAGNVSSGGVGGLFLKHLQSLRLIKLS